MAQLLAVVVGCNYRDSPQGLPELKGAEDDALHMATTLQNRPLAHGEVSSLALLLGGAASLAAVKTALQQALGRQTPEDTVLFYFAGHGTRGAQGLVLYTWDAPFPGGRTDRGVWAQPNARKYHSRLLPRRVYR